MSRARSNLTTAGSALKLITVPVEGAMGGMGVTETLVTEDDFAKPQAAEGGDGGTHAHVCDADDGRAGGDGGIVEDRGCLP